MFPYRRTKIVATIGPSSNTKVRLIQLLKAGVNIFRINMSHGSYEQHSATIELIKALSSELQLNVAILVDLQGPKIRIGKFTDEEINLKVGSKFILDADLDVNNGNINQVGLTYKQLVGDLNVGNRLLLDDGRIVLDVIEINHNKLITEVKVGGKLSNNKGLNVLGGGLSIASLSDKDKQDISFAKQHEVDYLALSFPKSAQDVVDCRKIAQSIGLNAEIVAKIERSELVASDEALDAIIEVSDVLMIARGDLGVEIGDAKLPAVQKKIIYRSRLKNKSVITATQMMETMITNSIPTRAEVFDVANAVIDGTDAVMLSGETAVGFDPENVVRTMSNICIEAESEANKHLEKTFRQDTLLDNAEAVIAMSAMYAVNNSDIKCIVCVTESGRTALQMSRIRSGKPILVLSEHTETKRKVALYRGVYSDVLNDIDINRKNSILLIKKIEQTLKSKNIVSIGDKVLITRGAVYGKIGGTSKMEIIEIA